MRARTDRVAFTLIELLVVVAMIAVLMALLLPAVQKVREAANKVRCLNNLKQIGLAMHNYANDMGCFPPAGEYPAGATGSSWSAQARILPYIEQDNVHKQIDFDAPYSSQPLVTSQRVPIYICPTEANDRPRPDGAVTHYPLNYAVNLGTWLVYDPATGQTGNGVFGVNAKFAHRDIRDGTSNTIAFSEVKAYSPYLRDSGTPSAAGTPPPSSPATVTGYGGTFKADSGHTEWVDARVHQTGFTTVFAPNTKVAYVSGSDTYDIDFNSSREGTTTNRITYAAATSRSYHPGLVNSLMVDGSVKSFRSTIDVNLWRALGTRAGGEVISGDLF